MEKLIIFMLIVILILVVALYFSLRKSIKGVTNSLSHINSTKTNSKVLISSTDNEVRALAMEINKSLEEKNHTEEKYKRMDHELRQAIANISHDLRTPLTSIMGYMQLIEDESLPQAERKEYINIVKQRSKALQMLIGGFYDLSRLEAKEYKFELKTLNLYNILGDITVSYYNDFVNNGIEPDINLDENIKPIIGDENAVRRIFSNLIQNILKYGKNNVSISLKQSNGYISTIFKNDAPDLNDKDAAHLFERFFTGDRARTGKSTGLGLAIAKQLVEQMGHKIEAKLEEGSLSIEIRWKV